MALTLFYRFSQDTPLLKTYLHRLIEVLFILPAVDFKNIYNNFIVFFYFQQYATYKLSYEYNKGFCYMLFLFVL